MEKTAVGDWFLLYLLGQNIDHIVFKVTNYNKSTAIMDDHTVDSKSREIIWSDFFSGCIPRAGQKAWLSQQGYDRPMNA